MNAVDGWILALKTTQFYPEHEGGDTLGARTNFLTTFPIYLHMIRNRVWVLSHRNWHKVGKDILDAISSSLFIEFNWSMADGKSLSHSFFFYLSLSLSLTLTLCNSLSLSLTHSYSLSLSLSVCSSREKLTRFPALIQTERLFLAIMAIVESTPFHCALICFSYLKKN